MTEGLLTAKCADCPFRAVVNDAVFEDPREWTCLMLGNLESVRQMPGQRGAGSRLHKGGQSSKSVTLIGSVGFQVLTVGPDTAGRSLPSTVAGLGV